MCPRKTVRLCIEQYSSIIDFSDKMRKEKIPLELKWWGIRGKINVYYLHSMYRYMKLQALLDEVSPCRTLVDRKENVGLFDWGFSQVALFYSFAHGDGGDGLLTLIPGDLNSRIETNVSSLCVFLFLFIPIFNLASPLGVNPNSDWDIMCVTHSGFDSH